MDSSLFKYSRKLTPEEQAAQFGDELWKSMLTECCGNIRKVDPLDCIYCLNMMHGLPVFVAIKHQHVQMRRKLNMILNSDY